MSLTIFQAKFKKTLYSFNLELDLSLNEGETLGILGPSGSGKSMSLRAIAGLIKPEHGVISLKGRFLFDSDKGFDAPPQQRRIGYVFQHYALFPHMTVAENISYALARTLKGVKRKERIHKLLEEIRLTEHASRYPSQLSGGQQQRVALMRALAADPDLLLLDEPFSALDAELRGELEALVLRFRSSHNVPYILVTHNLEEAYRLCDKLVIIEQGKVLQLGPKEELLRRPQTLEVARKVGAKNLWEGEVINTGTSGGTVYVPALNEELIIHSLPEAAATLAPSKVWLGIRPVEAVLLSGPEPGLPNTFPIEIINQIRGVQSHTLFVTPLGKRDGEAIQIEVPGHRLGANPPYLYLPPDKLFALTH